jgi:hypothetical protein
MSTSPPGPAGPAPSGRGRALVFFLVLLVLAVVAAAVPVIINLRQQLTFEELDKARQSWQEHGPSNYDLEYTVKRDRDPTPERYLVKVRKGRVVSAKGDGEELQPDQALRVEGIFARMDELLREDERSGRRNYAMAIFDPGDGHPKRFVHRVRGQPKREEWNILLKRVKP